MDPNVPKAKRIKFKTLVRNQLGPKMADDEVIDTQDEYEAWIASCAGDQAAFPKNIDWNVEMVLAVAAGEQPTAGHEIAILAVAEITGGFVGIQWEVLYTMRRDHGMSGQVITYPQHVVKTRKFGGVVTFRRVHDPVFTTLAVGEEDPRPTTLAVGEEDPHPTTLAVGEEDPHPTTLAVGEEGPRPTTLAVGEEGPRPTTLAVGEEDPPMTTLAVGEEDQRMTTLAVGEEDPRPTTLAVGEEDQRMTTMAVGEEEPRMTTMAVGEEGARMTTMATGEEDPGPTTMATGEESSRGPSGFGPFGIF